MNYDDSRHDDLDGWQLLSVISHKSDFVAWELSYHGIEAIVCEFGHTRYLSTCAACRSEVASWKEA